MLHVNVQKRRPFGGNVVVIPTSFLYPNALGNGFYPGGVNNNNLFGSGGGGIGGPLFDEIKPNESPAVSSNVSEIKTNEVSKKKNGFILMIFFLSNLLSYFSQS